LLVTFFTLTDGLDLIQNFEAFRLGRACRSEQEETIFEDISSMLFPEVKGVLDLFLEELDLTRFEFQNRVH